MRKCLFCFILFLLTAAAVFAGGQAEASSVPPSVDGIVEYMEGDVTVDGSPADFGTRVEYGAIVKTGSNAYCEIVFDNKNIFRIAESTVAEIRLSIEAPEIKIDKGTVAALFDKLDVFTSDKPFKLRTQTAVASVRGTAFFIKTVDADNTYLCICNGDIQISGADEANPVEYRSGHHKAVYYKNVNGRLEVSDAPMLYHSDEGMDNLASHIDERINWYY